MKTRTTTKRRYTPACEGETEKQRAKRLAARRPFRATDAAEPNIVEGHTYLARVTVDPWAGYPKHRSIVGKLVKVTAYNTVNVEWPSGALNSFSRSSVKVIGECAP